MTKEEILNKEYGRNIEPSPHMLRAMDEFSKQQSKDFAEHLATYGWERCDLNGPHAGLWISEMNIQYGSQSLDQLYSQFIDNK